MIFRLSMPENDDPNLSTPKSFHSQNTHDRATCTVCARGGSKRSCENDDDEFKMVSNRTDQIISLLP